MKNPFSLAGQVALITGSSRGIGHELARGFGRAGASVVVHGRTPQRVASALTALKECSRSEGWIGSLGSSCFDVTDEPGVEDSLSIIVKEHEKIDILVNNAGITHREPLVNVSLENWNAVIATDLTGAFLVGRNAARYMLARGSGSIINICSIQTELARPTIGAYVSAKGGLRNLTRAMAAEWAGSGVRVNALAPGYIETELTANLVADESFNSWIVGRTPASRWGSVQDLVGPAIFLASSAASFVHGQTLFVDGGMSVVV